MAIDMEGVEPFDEFLIGEIQGVVRDLNKSLSALKEHVPFPQQKIFAYTGLSLGWLETLVSEQYSNTETGKKYFNIKTIIQEMFDRWAMHSDALLKLKLQIEYERISHINKVKFMRLLDLVYKKFCRTQGDSASIISVWIDTNDDLNIGFMNEITSPSTEFSETQAHWIEKTDQNSTTSLMFEDNAIMHLIDALQGQISVKEAPEQSILLSFKVTELVQPDRDADSVVPVEHLTGILVSQNTERSGQMEIMFNDIHTRLKLVQNNSQVIKAFHTTGFDFIIVDCTADTKAVGKTVTKLRNIQNLDANVPILLLGKEGELDLIKLADKLLYDDILILHLDGPVSIRNKIDITRQKRREKTANLGGDTGGNVTLNSDRLVIDSEVLSGLKSAVGPEVFNELLLKLHADLMIVRAELKSASRDLDLFQIRRSTHVLISLAGSFGATDLHLLAQKLNILSNQEKREEVVVYLKECIRGLDLFIGFVVEEQSL
jgi:hypothetical protein